MGEDSFKTRVKGRQAEKKEQSRKSLTAKGIGYRRVRSKHVKGPDGYGKVILEAREKLIEKNGGKDPGPNTVAAHYTPGPHFEKGGGRARWKTRGENSAESNRARAKK